MTRQLARLGFDIAAPIIVYYTLRSVGASYLIALSAGAIPPAVGAGYTLLTRRQADSVALLMLTTIVAGLLTSLIAASPRFLLAKDGVFTGVWGVWFIASARSERPAALIFARPLMEGMKWFANRSWDALWETEPRFRKIWRVSSVIWGSGLLIDATVRVIISNTLRIDAVPVLGGALFPITFIVLQLVTNVYYNVAGLYPILGARWTARHRHPGELALPNTTQRTYGDRTKARRLVHCASRPSRRVVRVHRGSRDVRAPRRLPHATSKPSTVAQTGAPHENETPRKRGVLKYRYRDSKPDFEE